STEVTPVGQLMLPYYTGVGIVGTAIPDAWNSSSTYSANQVVQYGGYYFISKINSNQGNTPATITSGTITAYATADWSTWGQYKGVWNAGTWYRFNDMVMG